MSKHHNDNNNFVCLFLKKLFFITSLDTAQVRVGFSFYVLRRHRILSNTNSIFTSRYEGRYLINF